MIIRQARHEDMPEIMAIERSCFSVPWSEAGMLSELEGKYGLITVCTIDGIVAGFSVFHRFGNEGELFNIAVSEEFRRRGIAKRLMERLFEDAKKFDVERIFLEVRKSNVAARELYRSCGFFVCGERKNYYDAPREDAVLMDAEVTAPGEVAD